MRVLCVFCPLILSADPSKHMPDRPVLRVLSFYDPVATEAATKVFEFEEKAHCWVQWDFRYQYEFESFLNDGFAGYDVVTVDEIWIPVASDFLKPISDWGLGGSYEAVAIDPIIEAADQLAVWQGVSYGKPFLLNLYLYIYRADLFGDPELKQRYEQLYLKPFEPARNGADFLRLGDFFYEHTPYSGMAPITLQSEGLAISILWYWRMAGLKIESLDDLLKINWADARQGLEWLNRVFEIRPQGADDWFVEEVNSAYIKGEVPHIFQWTSLIDALRDPLYARAGVSSGYVSTPVKEELGQGTLTGAWFLSIPDHPNVNTTLAVDFVNWWRSSLTEPKEVPWSRAARGAWVNAWSRPKLKNYAEFSQILSSQADAMLHQDLNLEATANQLIDRLHAFARKEMRSDLE